MAETIHGLISKCIIYRPEAIMLFLKTYYVFQQFPRKITYYAKLPITYAHLGSYVLCSKLCLKIFLMNEYNCESVCICNSSLTLSRTFYHSHGLVIDIEQ